MGYIQDSLRSAVNGLSDQDYERYFAHYRFWFNIGLTYSQITPDQIFDDIWASRIISTGGLFHQTAHSIIRFAGDVESDSTLAPYAAGLQSRLCAGILRDFFDISPWVHLNQFVSGANFIASWANLGYIEESAIRNDILQSLIPEAFPNLYDPQADAIIVLFKIAGATFEAYADPSVVDRCFGLLRNHYSSNRIKCPLVQVRGVPSPIKVELKGVSRRYWIYGNVAGKAFLRLSLRRSLKRSELIRETQLPLLSPPLLDFPTEILSLWFPNLLDSKSLSQK